MRLNSFCLLLTAILPWLLAAVSQAAEPAFRRHVINADSTFPACAAIDVNRDGKLDIFCGGFWYEAPSWKRHDAREVEQIRGRYDDYSNLPLDVNRDGWPDIISVNYRSETIYWIEHPGKELGEKPWTVHTIDKPGAAETGRLADVDGDGRLDVLPNGAKYAAWFRLEWLSDDSKEPAIPIWTRHDLPAEAMGHGMGFGDIDGDGRGDLVTARGWLAAPEDRRKGRWVLQNEFTLHRDASIPIVVLDADGDGDQDIIYGRGHNIGLYWLEQGKADDGRTWTRHAIDTSWTQAHTVEAADIDGDGKPEIIAGKRYFGHDGRDLGEYDPLVIYSYKFLPETKSWRRGVIAAPGQGGFDLNPALTDLDGDGDLDVVAASRGGLWLFENLLASAGDKPEAAKEASQEPAYPDHSKLMVWRNDKGEFKKVESSDEWAIRRGHVLQGMEAVMGELPGSERRVPLDVKTLGEEQTPHYLRRRIDFASEPGDRVPAWLLIPNDLKGPTAAMLCLHQTTGIGKGEPAGLGGLPNLHYAHELANRGYVCLVPDYPSFGDYPYDFKSKGSHYASGSMKAIWNNLRAVDLLESLPQVDPDRIGCIGHSLGGHNTLFTSAFDMRLKAAVTSCGFNAFHHYYGGKLQGWTSDRYMPRIRDRHQNDPNQMPFDFYEVIGAIAPRGVFINAPLHDGNFEVEGVRKVVAEARKVYSLLEAPDALRAEYPDAGHDFPGAERKAAYAWLDKQLKHKPTKTETP